MQMQEPEQRPYQEGYEASLWAEEGRNQYQYDGPKDMSPPEAQGEQMQAAYQQQKIYPIDRKKLVRAIIGIILTSIGMSLFINGIVFSSIGIEYNAHNITLLTWSILGLVGSILFLVIDLVFFVLSIVIVSKFKKQRRNYGRPIHVNISIGEKQNSFRFNVNSPGEQLFERD